MGNAALLVFAMLLPTLIGGALIAGVRLWRRVQSRRDRGPVAIDQPIERIAADLRRLRGQRRKLLQQAPGPGRGIQTRALNAAYVDALTAACRALDVTPPRTQAGSASALEIRRVESDLSRRGLDVGFHEVR